MPGPAGIETAVFPVRWADFAEWSGGDRRNPGPVCGPPAAARRTRSGNSGDRAPAHQRVVARELSGADRLPATDRLPDGSQTAPDQLPSGDPYRSAAPRARMLDVVVTVVGNIVAAVGNVAVVVVVMASWGLRRLRRHRTCHP
ncbi:hypothetical protein ABZW18_18005 [Streptomyces sp. NPDC004647]|uniref:hypothetical protein n=1 Tax=Streptomyces sp. NPDC004647 TaxID=3154671 RepID=UPI0033AD63EB